jgi:hypothetical protein
MLKLVLTFIILIIFSQAKVIAENSFKKNDFSLYLQGETNGQGYTSRYRINIVFINGVLSVFNEVSGAIYSFTNQNSAGNTVRIFDENHIDSPSKNRQTYFYYLNAVELIKISTLLQKIKKLPNLINECMLLGDIVGTLILKTSRNRIHICIKDANENILDLVSFITKKSNGKLDFLYSYSYIRKEQGVNPRGDY